MKAWRARPIDEWKREILALCPKSATLLDQITGWDQVLTARYGDVRMRRWHGEGIIVLGDAAHAMSPQLGQGVNLALADASCLANCLARHPLPEALVHYQRRRRLTLRYLPIRHPLAYALVSIGSRMAFPHSPGFLRLRSENTMGEAFHDPDNGRSDWGGALISKRLVKWGPLFPAAGNLFPCQNPGPSLIHPRPQQAGW